MSTDRYEQLCEIAGEDEEFLQWLRMTDIGLQMMKQPGVVELRNEFDFRQYYEKDKTHTSHCLVAVIHHVREKKNG